MVGGFRIYPKNTLYPSTILYSNATKNDAFLKESSLAMKMDCLQQYGVKIFLRKTFRYDSQM